MPLHSTIDPKSAEFAGNAEVMRGLVTELRDKLSQVAGGGGKVSRARHTSRGKMLARDRVDLLVDPGTAFLELSPLAAHGPMAATCIRQRVITGVGGISGPKIIIVANDATIKGSTYYPMTVKSICARWGFARKQSALRLPQSTPALFCRYRMRSFGEQHFQPHFQAQARDVVGIPDCDRDGFVHRRRRLCAGNVDGSIIVRNQGTIFSGAALKAATGEVAPPKNQAVRCAFTAPGVTDHCAQNSAHAIASRAIIAAAEATVAREPQCREPREPLFPAHEIRRRFSRRRKPFDVHDIIARLVDGSVRRIRNCRHDADLRLCPYLVSGQHHRQQWHPVQRGC
jgi:3-methylcrotonyl-CoA carboxylase beta subunit